MTVAVAPEDPETPDALALCGRLDAFFEDVYGSGDGLGRSAPEAFRAQAGGAFLVARESGVAIGCGGLVRVDPQTAELKRMYVDPHARGRGLGQLLLGELLATARSTGYRRVRLETGLGQPEAVALYERSGFIRTPNYAPFEGEANSLCYVLDLRKSDPAQG